MDTDDSKKPDEPAIPPKLRKLYESAKKLAATRRRLEMWQTTAWALTPTATPTPRPTLPPLPWHAHRDADPPEIAEVLRRAEEDARREVEENPLGEHGEGADADTAGTALPDPPAPPPASECDGTEDSVLNRADPRATDRSRDRYAREAVGDEVLKVYPVAKTPPAKQK